MKWHKYKAALVIELSSMQDRILAKHPKPWGFLQIIRSKELRVSVMIERFPALIWIAAFLFLYYRNNRLLDKLALILIILALGFLGTGIIALWQILPHIIGIAIAVCVGLVLLWNEIP